MCFFLAFHILHREPSGALEMRSGKDAASFSWEPFYGCRHLNGAESELWLEKWTLGFFSWSVRWHLNEPQTAFHHIRRALCTQGRESADMGGSPPAPLWWWGWREAFSGPGAPASHGYWAQRLSGVCWETHQHFWMKVSCAQVFVTSTALSLVFPYV